MLSLSTIETYTFNIMVILDFSYKNHKSTKPDDQLCIYKKFIMLLKLLQRVKFTKSKNKKQSSMCYMKKSYFNIIASFYVFKYAR